MAQDHQFCPVYGSINLLQEKWTLHIVRALLDSPQGFNELTRSVGCNPSTLSHRLEKLEEAGVIEKTILSTMPPRTTYALTEAGLALQEVIAAISDWAAEHLRLPAYP